MGPGLYRARITSYNVCYTKLLRYEAGNYRFAIAQAEVTDLVQLTEHLDKLNKALKSLRDKRALDFAMLMVTDVVRGSSRLLVTDELPELNDLPYPPQPDGTRRDQRLPPRLASSAELAAFDARFVA